VPSDAPFARHSILPPLARPAALNGLAVVGMIVAALSFVASLVTAGYGTAVYLNSNAARDRLLRNAPAALPVSIPSQPVLLTTLAVTPIGRHGMDAAQRSATVDSLAQRIEMTADQAHQLDALLADDGAEIFGIGPQDEVSPPAILQMIGDHVGRLPVTADGSEPFFFETPAGRAEIYENRALFYRQKSLSPVRATAGRRMNATGHPILLPADVTALLGLAEDACISGQSKSKPLSDAQVQTLRSMLSDPDQQLVSLLPTPDGNQIGIGGAAVRADGYATLDFAGGALLLGPAGNIVLRSDRSSIPAVSSAACWLVILESLLSVGMAVFLLILSIGLFRGPRRRLSALVIWSAVKIGLSVLGAAAIGWMTSSFITHSASPARPHSGVGTMALLAGLVVGIAGIAFPIAVLIVSRTRSVREYYNPTE
jgi:hypothetical protein